MNFVKKYWPTILTAAGTAATFLLPSIQAEISKNPKSAISVLAAAIIAAYHSTSPSQK